MYTCIYAYVFVHIQTQVFNLYKTQNYVCNIYAYTCTWTQNTNQHLGVLQFLSSTKKRCKHAEPRRGGLVLKCRRTAFRLSSKVECCGNFKARTENGKRFRGPGMYTSLYVYLFIHIYICICILVYTNVCVYKRISVYMYMYRYWGL